jgi:hypothetical protein
MRPHAARHAPGRAPSAAAAGGSARAEYRRIGRAGPAPPQRPERAVADGARSPRRRRPACRTGSPSAVARRARCPMMVSDRLTGPARRGRVAAEQSQRRTSAWSCARPAAKAGEPGIRRAAGHRDGQQIAERNRAPWPRGSERLARSSLRATRSRRVVGQEMHPGHHRIRRHRQLAPGGAGRTPRHRPTAPSAPARPAGLK